MFLAVLSAVEMTSHGGSCIVSFIPTSGLGLRYLSLGAICSIKHRLISKTGIAVPLVIYHKHVFHYCTHIPASTRVQQRNSSAWFIGCVAICLLQPP